MKRIPNLETAINYCRDNDISFVYSVTKCKHIKFYVEDSSKFILISPKNDNRDRVIRDIRRMIDGQRDNSIA